MSDVLSGTHAPDIRPSARPIQSPVPSGMGARGLGDAGMISTPFERQTPLTGHGRIYPAFRPLLSVPRRLLKDVAGAIHKIVCHFLFQNMTDGIVIRIIAVRFIQSPICGKKFTPLPKESPSAFPGYGRRRRCVPRPPARGAPARTPAAGTGPCRSPRTGPR